MPDDALGETVAVAIVFRSLGDEGLHKALHA